MTLNYRAALEGAIDRSPLTIAPSGLVLDAIALMNGVQDDTGGGPSIGSRSGCVLVVEDRRLLGIFTERDVVRLIASGRELAAVKVAEAMQQPVTIKESEVKNIFTALSLLQQHRISHLPVVDDRDRLVGIVTETSLLQALGMEAIAGTIENLPQQSQERLTELEQINQQLCDEVLSGQLTADSLRFSQERLQLALEGSGDGLWDWNISTGEVYLSPRWLEMLGYAADELPGDLSTWDKLIHPEDKSWVMDTLNAHLKDRSSPYAFDYRMLTKSGEWKWIANFGKVVAYDRDGKPLRMAGTHRDISDRKQIEESLRESDERWHLALRGNNDGIWDWNVKTNEVFFSERWKEMLGYEDCEIANHLDEWAKRVHPDDLGWVMQAVQDHFAKKTPYYSTEHRVLCKDGTYKWILDRGQALWDEAGNVVRMAGSHTDISDRKQAEEELRHQSAELMRSNAELEQFAYVASHDLQEPLRMVVSYLQLLERRYKDKLDASADEFIAYAVDGASRMQTLINDLLEYSRVNTRAQPFVPIDCAQVLERALTNLKMAIAESSAVITCDPLPKVMADPTQLAQLFQNLIGNAIKFRGELAPQIHIGAKRNSDRWVFSISDNGIGIEPQYGDRIFAVFQRLHNRVKYKGTGIGLAICKKIVERHGGSIWVESALDRGSTFYFTIPDRTEVT
ncbi:PAS domain-containing protein [Pseudanabaena sp. PCC 6802]|uniref:PAS domain-containing protein n=1 Tax=Pseudanabaena sp. PCC 6802 TaxID=118173 RepID=UPI00034C244F|nr:PAS domain-containing protein [Pseudanabaena sp. PCC 6802]